MTAGSVSRRLPAKAMTWLSAKTVASVADTVLPGIFTVRRVRHSHAGCTVLRRCIRQPGRIAGFSPNIRLILLSEKYTSQQIGMLLMQEKRECDQTLLAPTAGCGMLDGCAGRRTPSNKESPDQRLAYCVAPNRISFDLASAIGWRSLTSMLVPFFTAGRSAISWNQRSRCG